VIESGIMRRAGHVARMGERRGVYRVLVGNLRERDHLGEPCGPWGQAAVICECGNEPSGSIKCGEFLK
jgi:hypothetical protein